MSASPFERVLANLETKAPFSPQDVLLLTNRLTPIKVKRGESLLQIGTVSKAFYYVEAGICRSYLAGNTGKDLTIMFAFPDWWITDMQSFIHQTPAKTNIEVLEDGKLLKLSHNDYDTLMASCPAFEKAFGKMMLHAYIREQHRVLEMISEDALFRYRKLVIKYPDIEQKIAQKHLASYLGITPEFLSMLKKKARIQRS